MKKSYIVIFLAVFLFSNIVKSQPNIEANGEVFIDTIIPRVDIHINPDTLEWIYENVESYQEFHATFIFNNGNILDTIENVGFRLRGNTSRYSAKKSFKVSFNKFESGRKWHNLEKLNLNGEHNDPSVIRAKLCWDLIRDFGVPGARTNHVELFINNNFHGLYLNVEHIDEEFVKSRFGNNDGNLFKCLWPADLTYLGPNPDSYKEMQGDRRIYDLKTNKAADDYTDLANFISVLNITSNDDFRCEIEKVFNVQDYLKIIAFDIFTSNWDGYIYNKNNFYLYHNTETGKFEYINYDIDNTFGIDWFGIDWGTRDIYDWHNGSKPLYTRIMQDPVYRDQYSYYMETFINTLVDDDYEEKVNEFKTRNSPYIQVDPFYPLDYGYTHQDYLDSFYESLGAHVTYGLFPYIDTRKTSALDQLENYNQAPVINYIRNNHPLVDEDLKIRAYIECVQEEPEVSLLYTESFGALQETPMYDDGEHGDKDAGDGFYGAIISSIQMNTVITYQIKAKNENNQESILPCEAKSFTLIESEEPQLFINEFMASNATIISDEFGEYDDWIEIYNGDSESVYLGDKYLSDNFGNTDKWLMPEITLEPGEFILIWADNDPEQGDHHTNFKLDAAGEEIGIYDSESTGYFLLDSISYGPQEEDISRGRKPDGDNNWIFFPNSTPGYSNDLGNIHQFKTNLNFKAFPNPAEIGSIFFDRPISFTLFTSTGIPLLKKEDCVKLNITGLSPGLYLIITEQYQSTKLMIQ